MNTNTAVISEIRSGILTIQEDAALYEETNFDSRADAIDFIDFHIIDRIEALLQYATLKKELDILKHNARQVKNDLERIDANLFKQLRENIRTGIYTKSSFSQMIGKYLGSYIKNTGRQAKLGYDNLDVFINALLSDQAIPDTAIENEEEMVFYQKTPARIVFRMAEMADLKHDDLFFDIGSGLGQAAILIHLITGAAARGIEYQPAYCNYAQACAAQLNLSNVQFINAAAHKYHFPHGTIFFMYTPFVGSMLQEMLEILQKESRKRTIRIFTYGPCSHHVARQNWLRCTNGNADDPCILYDFISLHNPLNT